MEEYFTLLIFFIVIIFLVWFGFLQFDAIERDARSRGYKDIVLMDVKGSDVGFFDEIGSVYVKEIVRRIDE